MKIEEIKKGLDDLIHDTKSVEIIIPKAINLIEELKAEKNKIHKQALENSQKSFIENTKLKEREKKLEKLVKNLCFDNGNYTSKEVEQLLKD